MRWRCWGKDLRCLRSGAGTELGTGGDSGPGKPIRPQLREHLASPEGCWEGLLPSPLGKTAFGEGWSQVACVPGRLGPSSTKAPMWLLDFCEAILGLTEGACWLWGTDFAAGHIAQ